MTDSETVTVKHDSPTAASKTQRSAEDEWLPYLESPKAVAAELKMTTAEFLAICRDEQPKVRASSGQDSRFYDGVATAERLPEVSRTVSSDEQRIREIM